MPENETLAGELLHELRSANRTKDRVIAALLGLVLVLILAMVGMSIYHNWLWSQFDVVEIDSSGSEGYTTYVNGENNGGVNNG